MNKILKLFFTKRKLLYEGEEFKGFCESCIYNDKTYNYCNDCKLIYVPNKYKRNKIKLL